MRRERGAAGPVIAPIFDCFEARFSPSVRYDSSCFALRRRTSGRSGGIEHPAFTLSGPFDRASLCGPLLELSLTNEQYVNRDRKACERTIEFNELLMTVDDLSLDDHKGNVASLSGITAGPVSLCGHPRCPPPPSVDTNHTVGDVREGGEAPQSPSSAAAKSECLGALAARSNRGSVTTIRPPPCRL